MIVTLFELPFCLLFKNKLISLSDNLGLFIRFILDLFLHLNEILVLCSMVESSLIQPSITY